MLIRARLICSGPEFCCHLTDLFRYSRAIITHVILCNLFQITFVTGTEF